MKGWTRNDDYWKECVSFLLKYGAGIDEDITRNESWTEEE